MYCKFGNFRENFIFANGVKRHICDVKNSRQRHDLPISVNDRVILPFHEGFIFTKFREKKTRIYENRTLAKISEFTVYERMINKNSTSQHTISDHYWPISEVPVEWRLAGGPIVARLSILSRMCKNTSSLSLGCQSRKSPKKIRMCMPVYQYGNLTENGHMEFLSSTPFQVRLKISNTVATQRRKQYSNCCAQQYCCGSKLWPVCTIKVHAADLYNVFYFSSCLLSIPKLNASDIVTFRLYLGLCSLC